MSKITEGLARVLATTHALALKTAGAHWNVCGPEFVGLHELFGKQYVAAFEAPDEIAERIRALGEFTPASGPEFAKLSDLGPMMLPPPDARAMVGSLLSDNDLVAALCRNLIHEADAAGDRPTADLLSERVAVHEKAAWMLRSLQG